MATRKKSQQQLNLNESERALLFMVTSRNKKSFDASRTDITEEELKGLNFVRENWTQEEIQQKGLAKEGVVTSFDEVSKKAESELAVDAPFADGIQKWQLPIDLPGFRVVMTRFPPGTVVKAHEHPSIPGFSACGQLRVVVKGSITYDGKAYGPGDWFYIPNGVAYSFTTDPNEETQENYFYQYNGIARQPLRFSNFSLNP
ncbi:cupin domain-containing protein [Caballeronia sp. KNU42]